MVRRETHRLSETLTQFLQYARPREAVLRVQDLNALITELAAQLRSDKSTLGKVKLTVRNDKGLAPFPFDADLVRQAVLNLALNSIQALAGKGRLTLDVSRREPHAAVVVADDGPGLSPEAQARLFEPFHTTKEKGTGLGLAVADRVVAAHGGQILVESETGRGASFTVLLPLTGGTA